MHNVKSSKHASLIMALAAATMLTACTTSDDALTLTHMSSLLEETNGLVLNDDGETGHAAMQNTTCSFDTLNGWVIGDFNLPSDVEKVTDSYGDKRVGVTFKGAHLFRGPDVDSQWNGRGNERDGQLLSSVDTIAAVLASDNLLASLADDYGCAVNFGSESSVSLDAAYCAPDVTMVTNRLGTVFVGSDEGVMAVDQSGALHIGIGGTLLAHDGILKYVYTAAKGGREVSAITESGSVVWTLETEFPVRDLDDMGDRAGVIIMLHRPDDTGQILMVDGETGEIHTRHQTPTTTDDITASEDGSTVAVVLDSEVHFYDVTADGEEPKVRRDLGTQNPQFGD